MYDKLTLEALKSGLKSGKYNTAAGARRAATRALSPEDREKAERAIKSFFTSDADLAKVPAVKAPKAEKALKPLKAAAPPATKGKPGPKAGTPREKKSQGPELDLSPARAKAKGRPAASGNESRVALAQSSIVSASNSVDTLERIGKASPVSVDETMRKANQVISASLDILQSAVDSELPKVPTPRAGNGAAKKAPGPVTGEHVFDETAPGADNAHVS